jgi:hypothetical protein
MLYWLSARLAPAPGPPQHYSDCPLVNSTELVDFPLPSYLVLPIIDFLYYLHVATLLLITSFYSALLFFILIHTYFLCRHLEPLSI